MDLDQFRPLCMIQSIISNQTHRGAILRSYRREDYETRETPDIFGLSRSGICEPVELKLQALTVTDVALAGVNGEVVSVVGST